MTKKIKIKDHEISIVINKEVVAINDFTISTGSLKKLWLIQFIAKQIVKIIIFILLEILKIVFLKNYIQLNKT